MEAEGLGAAGLSFRERYSKAAFSLDGEGLGAGHQPYWGPEALPLQRWAASFRARIIAQPPSGGRASGDRFSLLHPWSPSLGQTRTFSLQFETGFVHIGIPLLANAVITSTCFFLLPYIYWHLKHEPLVLPPLLPKAYFPFCEFL